MYTHGTQPNIANFSYVLRRCIITKSLLDGQNTHFLIILAGLEHNDELFGNLLITMYAQCGLPYDACKMLDLMPRKNSKSWNLIISAYGFVGNSKKACSVLNHMSSHGIMPDIQTVVNVLNACSSESCLEDGKVLHFYVASNQLDNEIIIRNALITMYGRCGSLDFARKVFEASGEKDVVTWTAIITGLVKQGHAKEALYYFDDMIIEGKLNPDRVTFISMIDGCASLANLELGQIIHAQVIEAGIVGDIFIETSLLNMYGKSGCLYSSKFVFDKMRERNIVAWNAMLTIYAKYKLSDEALNIFWLLHKIGMKLNKVTFVNVLNACESPANLVEGKKIHHLMVEDGIKIMSDVIVGSVLLTMYSECGSLDDAQRIFDRLIQKNVVSWTSLLSAYVMHGYISEAFSLFFQMQEEGLSPNQVTFSMLFDACADQKVVSIGEVLCSMILESEIKLDDFLSTSLLIMYGKCGKLEDARRIFDSIQSKNVVSYTAMVTAYTQFNHPKEAVRVFVKMYEDGVNSDDFTFTTILDALTSLSALMDGKLIHNLIIERCLDSSSSSDIAIVNMYGKCGVLDDAHNIFNKIVTQSTISFNALITAYAQHEQGEEAFALYLRLQYEGFNPDHITFISTVDACAGLVELVQVKALHIHLRESGIVQDIVIETALLNLYSKCGDFNGANKIFEGMAVRDVASWNAVIASYSQHGHGKEVVKLFKRMEADGLKPDEITFVNFLSACSRAGMINEAREYFDSMSQTYGIVPTVEHYACMADVFGRAGLLIEAENFLRKMPKHPSPVAWLTLLSSCKSLGDVERARYSAGRIFEIDPKHTGARMMLSNIFSLAGMWDEAANVIEEIV